MPSIARARRDLAGELIVCGGNFRVLAERFPVVVRGDVVASRIDPFR